MKARTFLVGLALVCGTISQASVIVSTLPEYNGPDYNPNDIYPLAPVLVGNFSYSIPSGETITSAIVSGQFGNSETDTSAGVDLYLQTDSGSVVVGQVIPYGPGWSSGPLLWSANITGTQLTDLYSGNASLWAQQTSEYVVRLGESKLTINTTGEAAVPGPAAALPMVAGLAAAYLRRRRK